MSKRYLNISVCFVYISSILLLLSSCKDSSEQSNLSSIDFGDITYYESFLWVDRDIDTLSRVLEIDFNEPALNSSNTYVILEVNLLDIYDKKLDQDFDLLINNVKQEEKKIRISSDNIPENNELKISIVFDPNAQNSLYKGYLTMTSSNKLDRLNETLIEQGQSQEAPIFKWEARFTKIMNPLLKWILIILAILITLLLIWFLILKYIFFPRFRGGQFVITVEDKDEDRINLVGKIGCVFGNYKPPSKLYTVFCGQYQYSLRSETFTLKFKPVNFNQHRDNHHKRKRLVKLIEFKNLGSLKKLAPDELAVYGKEIMYNNYTYIIDSSFVFEYLYSKHEYFE